MQKAIFVLATLQSIQESKYSFKSFHFYLHYKALNFNRCTTLFDPKQECERQAGLKRILPPVVTAKLRSKKSFSFKYGRIEIRAKLPKGDWLFPREFQSFIVL